MLALLVEVPTMYSVYQRSAVLPWIQIFYGSQSASAHLRWLRSGDVRTDNSKLNGKYVKINSERAVRNSENLT